VLALGRLRSPLRKENCWLSSGQPTRLHESRAGARAWCLSYPAVMGAETFAESAIECSRHREAVRVTCSLLVVARSVSQGVAVGLVGLAVVGDRIRGPSPQPGRC
jgi:hypothetical protein